MIGLQTQPTPLGVVLGSVILLFVLLLLGGYRWTISTRYLPTEEQRRAKRYLRAQIADYSPSTLRVPREDFEADPGAVREQVRATFEDGADAADDRITIPTALRRVAAAVREQWGVRTRSIPQAALALAEEAVALVAIGVVLFVPADAVIQAMSRDADLSPSGAAREGGDSALGVVETGIDVLGAFPFADSLFAFGLTLVTMVVQNVYGLWWQLALLLLAGAVAITALERRLPDDVGTEFSASRLNSLVTLVAQLAIVWVAGVVPAAIGGALGVAPVGAVIGMLAAVGVTLLFGVHWARNVARRLRYVGRHRSESIDAPAVAYVLVRRASLSVGVLSLPLLVVYAIAAIGTGAIFDWARAIATGPVELQALVIVCAVLGVVVLAYAGRDAMGDLHSALAESLSRTSVRVALLGRGLPVAGLAISFALFSALLPSAVWGYALAAIAAVLVGVVLRIAFVVLLRLQRRTLDRETGDAQAARAVVQAYSLDTPDGGELYFARVNTVEVAHDDLDGAVDAVLDVMDGLFDDRTVSPMVAREFATDALRVGFVDIDDTEQKLRNEVVDELVAQLDAENGAIEEQAFLDDHLPYCPDDLVEDELLAQEYRHERILRRNGYIHVV